MPEIRALALSELRLTFDDSRGSLYLAGCVLGYEASRCARPGAAPMAWEGQAKNPDGDGKTSEASWRRRLGRS